MMQGYGGETVKKTLDVAFITWVELLVEFNSKYYIQAVINTKWQNLPCYNKGVRRCWSMSNGLTNYRGMHRTWFLLSRARFGDF